MVHAIRVAVRSARIDWKSIEATDTAHAISGKMTFRVEIEEDTLDGGFVASCKDLPGCYSHGDTEQEAAENLVEAIVGVMEARMQRHLRQRPLHDDDDPPSPSRRPHRHTLELPVT